MPSTSILWLYATHADLVKFGDVLDAQCPYDAISTELCEPGETPASWTRLDQIPNLGVNTGRDMIHGDSVLIVPRGMQVPLSPCTWKGKGSTRRQLIKADGGRIPHLSFVLCLPGVNRKEEAMLHGEAQVDSSFVGTELHRALLVAKRAAFKKRGRLTIGEDAITLVREGWRLATNLDAGKRYDFPRTMVLKP